MKQLNPSLKLLEELLFSLTLLLLPTQLGLHFWPSFSYIHGIRVDYLSPTLFISDISVFMLCIVWALRRVLAYKYINTKVLLFPALFFGILIIGILFSKSPLLGWYGLVKILEFVFVGYYCATVRIRPMRVLIPLMLGIWIEVVLAALQFYYQGSLQGIFYFLGERSFSGSTPGVANANLSGKLVVRPYATFPHPNVLAGYLLVTSLLITIGTTVEQKKKEYSFWGPYHRSCNSGDTTGNEQNSLACLGGCYLYIRFPKNIQIFTSETQW